MRIRFAACVLLLSGLLCGLGYQFVEGFKFQSSILSLVPSARLDPQVERARAQQAGQLSRRLIFLFGSDSPPAAETAARRFAQQLSQSAAIEQVLLEPQHRALPRAQALMPYRLGLLSDQHRQWLASGEQEVLFASALQAHFTLSGAARLVPAANDLAGLLSSFVLDSSGSQGNIEARDGLLWVNDGDRAWALVRARLSDDPFDAGTLDSAMRAIEQAQSMASSPQVRTLRSGVLFHAAKATRRAKLEIAAFSLVATTLVVALLWHALGSPLPLLFSLATLACGVGAGVLACQWWFGSVHLITLVFGTSLIGVGIDYALHFLCDQYRPAPPWKPALALSAVGGAILFGHLTTVLGYSVMLLTPFPGLRQMALFSIVGLIVCCTCVLCLFPRLPIRTRRDHPMALNLSQALARGIAPVRGSWPHWVAATLLVALIITGLQRLAFEDDVRVLQTPAPQLFAQDQRVAALIGSELDSRFLLLRADSPEALLQLEESVAGQLQALRQAGALKDFNLRAQVRPSKARQTENRQLQKAHVWAADGLVPRLMQTLGASEQAISERRDQLDWNAPLLSTDDADPAFAHPLDELWLGRFGEQHFSVALISGIRQVDALKTLADQTPSVAWVDRVAEISSAMRSYRQQVLQLLGGVAAAVLGLLIWRYGGWAALRTLTPPLGACLIALATLGWSGVPANLFSVLALLMLLGLGIDYGVFLREGGPRPRSALLAVSLSATTTLCAFGLLALSATPFLATIGLTLVSGILATLLLSLWFRPAPGNAA